ncbi:MAG: hypothetical protein NTU43_01815 [Bacteroidetes bacterium]|nr:hypothetical protein [Bacteroidota bacterium]
MTKVFPIKQNYTWLLLFVIIGFVIIKWEALFLPFYWDEAWVYLPAIRTMALSGPSIMPASIHPDLYTGHPLLFYFLASLWIKTWGYSLFAAHIFPLLISITLLISIYYISYDWANNYFTAFIATLLVAIQPIFLAQSTFLLIEVWLALLFVWAFYFYFKEKWVSFSITLVLALWSKESAYCLVPAFIMISATQLIFKTINRRNFIHLSIRVILVFIVGFSFFIIQKYKLGWLFFPRHANWITFEDFGDKMSSSFMVLFISQGRNAIYILTTVIVLVSFIVLKNKRLKKQVILLISFLIISIGFMLFASINFFSPRYLFAVIPLLMIGVSFLICSINNSYYSTAIIIVITIIGYVNINRSIEGLKFGDVELSYTRLLKAQVQFCNELETNKLNGNMYAPFLMYVNLSNKYAGFVNNELTNLNQYVLDTSNVYYIKVSNENCNELDSLISNNYISLDKSFVDKQAKIELYKRNPF